LFDDVPGSCDPGTGRTIPEMGSRAPGPGTIDPGITPPCQPGQRPSRNGHEAPQAAGTGKPYAFDWSVARGIAAVNPAGFKLGPRTLDELIRTLPPGATLVGESTFESYDLRQRQHVIDLAESRGVTLLTVPARGNPKRRAAAGLPEKTGQSRETDYDDARAIQHAAITGAHLKKPALVEDAWAELREQAARRFIYLRYSGQKDDYAVNLRGCLPAYYLEPLDRRIALGPYDGSFSTSYNLVILAAVGVATEFVSARADFERLTGLYAHGYPNQFRSDLMYWGWGRQAKKRERITLSVYRRELRWLFNQLMVAKNDAG
jgi:hypothetical protein